MTTHHDGRLFSPGVSYPAENFTLQSDIRLTGGTGHEPVQADAQGCDDDPEQESGQRHSRQSARFSGHGSGQDKPIGKKRFRLKNIIPIAMGLLVAAFALFVFFIHEPERSITVDAGRVTISEVKKGIFREYIPVNGSVIPERTIYLDAVESGRIDRILVEDGEMVSQDDTILVMTNNNLQLEVLNREAQILEQINNLQNTRLAIRQERLRLHDEMITQKYELMELEEEYLRISSLAAKNMIAEAEHSSIRKKYERAGERMDLLNKSVRLDSLSATNQLEHLESSLERMMVNLEMVRRSLDHLVLTAPVTGQISSFTAEIGESWQQGERIGQIDVPGGFRIRAGIDEHYLSRVTHGQRAFFDFAGRTFELEIMRVYPEITGGRFNVDFIFVDEMPVDIRRGQTVRLRLELGEPGESVLLSRGGFFQSGGGNWVFVLNRDRNRAFRRPVQLGRQNPEYYEVLYGLEPGDLVITSSYEHFRNFQQLQLQ